jgi:hypothetical protein
VITDFPAFLPDNILFVFLVEAPLVNPLFLAVAPLLAAVFFFSVTFLRLVGFLLSDTFFLTGIGCNLFNGFIIII